jgi:hypothetical protein
VTGHIGERIAAYRRRGGAESGCLSWVGEPIGVVTVAG